MDMDEIMRDSFSGSSSDTNLYNCQTKDFLAQNVINVLVVDDDVISLSIATAILTKWKYRVTRAKHAIDALCTLRMKDGIKFDMVITDVHMPDMDGFELQKQIYKEFANLPVVFMSGDQTQAVVAEGLTSGGLGFLKKPIAAEDVRDLWQYVHELKKDLENDKKESQKIAAAPENNNNSKNDREEFKEIAATASENNKNSKNDKREPQKIAAPPENNNNSKHDKKESKKRAAAPKSKHDKKESSKKRAAVPENNNDNSNGGTGQSKKDLKRLASTRDDNTEEKKEKKAKLVWTAHLHYRFLDALRIMGKGRCVPKNILEYMNVPALTREHIASHLQKYRLYLNRVKEKSGRHQYSRMADLDLQCSSFLSENPNSLMLNNVGQQQMLAPSLHQRTEGNSSFPVVNLINLTNVSNPNHGAPVTNPRSPSGYGQSRLLTHPAISSGPTTGTSSSLTMYQPPKQAPPNLLNNGPSTYGTPTLGVGGHGGSTAPACGTIGASSSSGPFQNLSLFNTNYNGYQTRAEQNFVGHERLVDQASGSMKKPHSSIFDLVFTRKPDDHPSDLSGFVLNGINEQSSSNHQQIEQQIPNLSTLMGSNHVGVPLLMNGQNSNDMQQNDQQQNPNLGSTSKGSNHDGDLLLLIEGQYSSDMQQNEQADHNLAAGISMGAAGISIGTAGTSMVASHVEDPLMMNGRQHFNDMHIDGEDATYSIFGDDRINFDDNVTYSILGNDEVDLDEFFSWFDKNPNQMDIGETSMRNESKSNPSASHPTPAGVIDDEDFLASLLVSEDPYGIMDLDNFDEQTILEYFHK